MKKMRVIYTCYAVVQDLERFKLRVNTGTDSFTSGKIFNESVIPSNVV